MDRRLWLRHAVGAVRVAGAGGDREEGGKMVCGRLGARGGRGWHVLAGFEDPDGY